MAEYTLLAKISADASGFKSEVSSASSAFEALTSMIGNVGSVFSSFGGLATTLGGALAPVTGGLTALGVAAGKTTVDFMKVYQASMTTFKQFYGSEDAARGLYNSLYEVASASTFSQESFLNAAQRLAAYGTSAENVTRYMQVAADAVSAFGGSSQDLEQMAGVFGKVQREGRLTGESLAQFADAGVDAAGLLAKQMGVTSDEIRKMASDGALPAAEALDALSTALEDSSNGFAGMAAQIKGGSITGALDSMNSAWRTFSLNLTGINPTIGASADQLAQAEQRSLQLAGGIGSLNKIIPQMSGLFASATTGIGTFLDKMVGTEAIVNDAGVVIGYTGGVLTELANAFGSLKAAGDSVSLEPLRASLQGLADQFPVLSGLIDGFFNAFDSNGDMILTFEEMRTALQGIGDMLLKVGAAGAGFLALGATFSLVGSILGGVSGALGSVGALFGGLASGAGTLGTAISSLSPGFSSAGGSATTLRTVLSGLMSPVGLIIAGVALLVGAFIYLMTTNEEFAANMQGIWDRIVTAVQPIIDTLMTSFQTLATSLMPLVDTLLNALVPVFETLGNVIAILIEAIAPLVSMLVETLIPIFTQIVETITPIIELIINSLVPVFESLANIIGVLIEAIAPLVATVLETLLPIFQQIIEGVTPVIETILNSLIPVLEGLVPIFDLIAEVVQKVMPILQERIETVMGIIQEIWDRVWPHIQSVLETVMSVIQPVVETAMGAIENIINIVTAAIDGDWDAVWTGIQTFFEDIWNGIGEIADNLINGIKDTIIGIVTDIKTGIENIIGDVAGVFEDGLNAAKDVVSGFIDDAITWGSDLIDNFVGGIMDGIGAVADAAASIAGEVAAFIGFSEPEKGELSRFHTYMPDMMQGLADGMYSNMGTVRKAASVVAQSMAQPLEMGINAATGSLPVGSAGSGLQSVANSSSYGNISINMYGDVANAEEFVVKVETALRQITSDDERLANT